MSRKSKILLVVIALIIVLGAGGIFYLAKGDKKTFAIKSLSIIEKVAQLLPIQQDTKKELEVVNSLVSSITQKDGKERAYLVMLQNDMELRPGGGFLGQYAIVKVKDGEVTSTFVEDANILDQRITAKVGAPYPFQKMMGTKKWKFRDSNFSPDFPTNVEKAKYFYRLSGRSNAFDGVIAVNTDVFNDVLKLTGPITVPGYSTTFTSDDGALKLEELVEKQYLMNENLNTQNRKAIMKTMAPIIVEKLFTLGNLSKLSDFVHQEMQKKNIMLNFTDSALQAQVESVHWDGAVAKDWTGDYLMAVDANMGALKTDYYMKREMTYNIDLTQEKPVVDLHILYKNTAPYGDWRTSDYHTYVRLYVPKGANLLERKMVSYPNVGEDFGKTYFGFICHVLIGGQTDAYIKYELPADFPRDDYRLLIQKQSGVDEIPTKIHVKTKDGKEYDQELTISNDVKLEFQK